MSTDQPTPAVGAECATPPGTDDNHATHRPPAPTPAEHNERMQATRPNDLIGNQ